MRDVVQCVCGFVLCEIEMCEVINQQQSHTTSVAGALDFARNVWFFFYFLNFLLVLNLTYFSGFI